jgi:hypothetical protein
MDLSKIITVTGASQLYSLVSNRGNGVIVEDLSTGKRTFLPSNARLNVLEAIAIYTEDETIPLKEVFTRMLQDGSPTPEPKAPDTEQRLYFTKIVPEHNPRQVYISDIKKAVRWFNTLNAKGLLTIDPVEETTPTEE